MLRAVKVTVHERRMRRALLALYEGALPDPDRETLTRHVQDCVLCRMTLDSWRSMDADLRRSRPTTDSLSAERAEALFERALQQARLDTPSSARFVRRPLGAICAAAAMALLAAGAVSLYRSHMAPVPSGLAIVSGHGTGSSSRIPHPMLTMRDTVAPAPSRIRSSPSSARTLRRAIQGVTRRGQSGGPIASGMMRRPAGFTVVSRMRFSEHAKRRPHLGAEDADAQAALSVSHVETVSPEIAEQANPRIYGDPAQATRDTGLLSRRAEPFSNRPGQDDAAEMPASAESLTRSMDRVSASREMLDELSTQKRDIDSARSTSEKLSVPMLQSLAPLNMVVTHRSENAPGLARVSCCRSDGHGGVIRIRAMVMNGGDLPQTRLALDLLPTRLMRSYLSVQVHESRKSEKQERQR